MHTKLMADDLVLQPLGTGQDDPRALSKHLSRPRPGRQRRQFRALNLRQRQRLQPPSRHVCLPPSVARSLTSRAESYQVQIANP